MSSPALVPSGRAADPVAWEQLVRRYEPLLRAVARRYRLAPTDLEDAMQTTWLELFRALGTLRNPAALPGWLSTTMSRQCLRALQRPVRELLVADVTNHEASAPDALSHVLAAERRAALAQALDRLPRRHRALVAQLGVEGYGQASERLGIPIGSIGPIRARAFARLERDPGLRELRAC